MLKLRSTVSAAALISGLCLGAVAVPAVAQDAQPRRGAVDTLSDTIVVTARKRGVEENVQDVPIAITAYGSDQLDALKVRDLLDLTYSMPNVALEDIATARGVANFSIRGLGVNSSIPSIDPAVGVFVDGMYLGINAGVVFETFDLQSIEVLRGPQGVLFGRNVTGGAVLVNTKKPSDQFEVAAKTAVESGFRDTGLYYNAMAYVTGPVMSDKVLAKVSGYYAKDEGWFKNSFDGETHGEAETWIVRPAVTLRPWTGAELTVRYEHGDTEGDGPSAQSHINGGNFVDTNDDGIADLEDPPAPGFPASFDRESHDFSIDEPGFGMSEWDQVIAQFDAEIGFGEGGKITNIFGWRDYSAQSRGDIDAQPLFLFHAPAWNNQDQISNELRFFGRFFDRMDFTGGVYYFEQTLNYAEQRELLGVALLATPLAGLPLLIQSGGGNLEHETFGVFANGDIDLTDALTLYAGVRWSWEAKDAQIANLVVNARGAPGNPLGLPDYFSNPVCNIVTGPDCIFTLEDDDEWTAWSPRVGLQYDVDDDSLVYAQWARSFRSGGYNLRDTASPALLGDPTFSPGPFDQEQVDSYEAGVKTGLWGRGLLNGAIFFTQIDDMQREVNLPSAGSGVLQIIKNTADAEIFGFELESQIAVTENFMLLGSVGYTDGDYVEVRFDLDGDGLVDAADLSLEIPRLAPWTYNAGFVYDYDFGNAGIATLRFNYAHRDKAFYTDNNRGFLNEADVIDASLAFQTWDNRAIISIYGRNLLNDVQHGNDTQLDAIGTFPVEGTFAPLVKGRVIGLELQVRYN